MYTLREAREGDRVTSQGRRGVVRFVGSVGCIVRFDNDSEKIFVPNYDRTALVSGLDIYLYKAQDPNHKLKQLYNLN